MTTALPPLPDAPGAYPEHADADDFSALPADRLAAWTRVLTGCAACEGMEEWIMQPVPRALAARGHGTPETLAFFEAQGADELRHAAYLTRYVEQHLRGEARRPSLLQRLAYGGLYEGVFRPVISALAAEPLYILLPLLAYERSGTAYMTRLARAADPELPGLAALLASIRTDEARHIVGVRVVCARLIAESPPGPLKRAALRGLLKLVVADMRREAWWKPGLMAHMAALGFDVPAYHAELDRISEELEAMLEPAR